MPPYQNVIPIAQNENRHHCERQVEVDKCLRGSKSRAHGDDGQRVSQSNTNREFLSQFDTHELAVESATASPMLRFPRSSLRMSLPHARTREISEIPELW